VIEGTRVAPELAANVAAVWTAANVNDDTEDDEANNGSDLDDSKDKLSFTISFDTIRRQ
jgi:hypothetical protein